MPYRRLNTGDLVARIIAGITDGRGLIPLVGSGLSVESGIPTGQGLQPYLEHVLYRCLNDGLDLDRTGWPPLTDAPAAPAVWPAPGKEAPLAQEAARARGRWNDSLGLLSRLERRADGQPWLGKPDSKVIDSFGHLLTRDARSNFGHAMLAQLARAGRIRTVLTTNFDDLLEDAFRRVRLELEVYDITTSGSLPDHRMVAASPALIKLHGTRVGIRADHTLDHAPDRSDVYTFASYLCGARFDPDSAIFHWSSLRKPQARGAAGNAGRRRAPRRLAPPEPLTLTRDLLVLGFGGRDLRIMQLVVHAINVIMSQRVLQRVLSRADAPTRRPLAAIPRVHWICHTQSDVDKLQETLDELGASPTLQRCFWVTVEDAQVLLHELYTTLTGTVPSRGLDCDFIRDIAPEPTTRIEDEKLEPWLQRLAEPASAQGQLFVVPQVEGTAGGTRSPAPPPRGISGQAAALYWKLSGQPRPYRCEGSAKPGSGGTRRCIWLEPSVFPSPDALLRGLLSRIASRNGRSETGLLAVDGGSDALRRVCTRFDIIPRQWVIFVYARDGGGGLDLSWTDRRSTAPARTPPNWGISIGSPLPLSATWTAEDWVQFTGHLLTLKDAGFTVIYMPFGPDRREHLSSRVPNLEPGAAHLLARNEEWDLPEMASGPETKAAQRDVLEQAIHWALDASWTGGGGALSDLPPAAWRIRKLRFLHALCLCRQFQSRFVLLTNAAVLCVEPFNMHGTDNDSLRVSFVDWALDELSRLRLLRRRPGGFVWMHRDVRLALQAILEDDETSYRELPDQERAAFYSTLHARIFKQRNDDEPAFDARGFKSRMHLAIAEAFEAAYRSTSSYWLIVEELYHLHQALFHAPTATRSSASTLLLESHGVDGAAQQRLNALLVERYLIRISRILRSARLVFERGADNALIHKLFPATPPLVLARVGATVSEQEKRILRLYGEYRREWSKLRSQLRANSKGAAVAPDDVEREDDGQAHAGVAAVLRRLDRCEIRCLNTRLARSSRRYESVKRRLYRVLAIALAGANRTFFERLKLLAEARYGVSTPDRRLLFLAAADWLHEMPHDSLRNRRVVVVTRLLREIVWVWTDELEDRLLFCWSKRRVGPADSGLEQVQRKPAREPTLEPADWKLIGDRMRDGRVHAQRVCVLSNLIQELSCFLDVEAHLEEDQRVLGVRTYYAQGLAFLERFKEAHCHLNDAFGRLNRSRFSSQEQYWAYLELRRGAVYLLEAQFSYVGSSHDQKRTDVERSRRILSVLDDAWLAFTRARHHLRSGPQLPRHWGRLFVYELRTLSMYADLERLAGCPVEGLPDRLPGGRLRRTLELLRAEAVLAGGTRVRGAQVAYCAYVVLRCEDQRAASATPDQQKGGWNTEHRVRAEIDDLLQLWRSAERSPTGYDEPSELADQLRDFVTDVAQLIESLPDEPLSQRHSGISSGILSRGLDQTAGQSSELETQ